MVVRYARSSERLKQAMGKSLDIEVKNEKHERAKNKRALLW